MSHDLDEINAALKLGDSFIPPGGSVCELYPVDPSLFEGGNYEFSYTVRVVCFSVDSSGSYLMAEFSPGSLTRWPLSSWRIVEVHTIPPGSPPFSEWKRP